MKKKIVAICLMFLLAVGSISVCVHADNADYGTDAYRYMRYLNDVYPDRVQNTQQVREAGAWIKSLLEAYGYTVKEMVHDAFGMRIVNYVVEKPGNSAKTVYIGAHYDCVAGATTGADDNASGVGVLLELAKRFYNTPTEVSLKFCFFDAEEVDYACAGSYLYVEQLSQEERDNCLLYVNLDTVGAGDHLFAYGGYYDANHNLQDIWGLNMADAVAKKLGTTLLHMPEAVGYYEAPTRATGSDHQYFKSNGMSYVYFEANAWQYPDGSINEEYPWMLTSTNAAFLPLRGQIMHSANDNMDIIEAAIPGTIQRNLTNVSKIVSQMIREFTPNSPQIYAKPAEPTPEPTTEAPTTQAPTTQAPTTVAPTTQAPTTTEPTTEETTIVETETTEESLETSQEETTPQESSTTEITTEESTTEAEEPSSTEEESSSEDVVEEPAPENDWLFVLGGFVMLACMSVVFILTKLHRR